MSDSAINIIQNDITRVMRNDAGQYGLKDGSWVDFFDPARRDDYLKKTFITYKTYTLEGVVDKTGALRQMSIGQLVMALCLQRATTVEGKIIELMENIATNTAQINALSVLDGKIGKFADGKTLLDLYWNRSSAWKPTTGENLGMTQEELELFKTYSMQGYGTIANCVSLDDSWCAWLKSVAGYTDIPIGETGNKGMSPSNVTTILKWVNDKLDSLNSLSQELLIELQSQTSKRDQAYDMVSAILKSLNSVLAGNANNL